MNAAPPTANSPLKFLILGWFAIVMGLTGLALAWHRAIPVLGDEAGAISVVIGGVALSIFLGLVVLSGLRASRFPAAFREDFQHPARHPFVAAAPISILLLTALWVAHAGPSTPVRIAWWVGSLGQLAATWWVLSRWWTGFKDGKPQPQGLGWPAVTPVLILPIVGNVLAPLAGVPLGHEAWAAAQFGVGLAFWPVVMILIVVRMAVAGLWPDRLLPTAFIFVAPPAVMGLSLLQLGAPTLVGWAAWGMALMFLLWAGVLAPRIAKLPFAIPHWGASFPLAAFAALTLRLAPGVPAMVVLALASVVIAGLLLATWRGLRTGTLLAPEPVAAIQPVTTP